MVNTPVDVLWIARYDYGPDWSLRIHHHDFLQMIYFLDGRGVFTLDGREFPIRGGEFFLIRSGAEHGLRAESLLRTLDVKFRVAPGSLSRRLRRANVMLQWDEPGLAARFERIRAEGEQKMPFYRELCGALLIEILCLFLRADPHSSLHEGPLEIAEHAPHDPVLDRALASIRARYHAPLTVREIARDAGCTERTLRLHFQRVMQLRPLTYLQRYRVGKAKTLIQYSDYALKDIAEQVGFQTVHHFTRMFTALEGHTPAAWRREYSQGIRKDVYINPRFENRSETIGFSSEPRP